MQETQSKKLEHMVGNPCPLGATYYKKEEDAELSDGVNFSVFSSEATSVTLLLFKTGTDTNPFVEPIILDKAKHCEFGFWNVFVKGIGPGIHYAYRMDGLQDVSKGSRYNQNKVLVDPYAKAINTCLWNRGNACDNSDNQATSMRGCVLDISDYKWEGDKEPGEVDKKPHTPLEETIIYEMHVKGFTNSSTSKVQNSGTYLGIIDKIPYLKELGVTAVELLPIMQFDETEPNYWGYSTVGFFAPHHAYCVSTEESNQINEFRDMVKAFHKSGIEVILDVVYNHTSEGDHRGPVINFKGIDNRTYYHLYSGDKQYYMNYSGCGNSFSCNHPIAQKLIIESLKFWARDMHIDGFRFDLGTILTLNPSGDIMTDPPVLWGIELDDKLTGCKLIAEPWGGNDKDGLYQLGTIHGYRWSQWNGLYRDCIRGFVKGDPGRVAEMATRIAGSPDLFKEHRPSSSINFITCHDGFTLNDLVSYNQKHNLENRDANSDAKDDGGGTNNNISWNCGFEGETQDSEVIKLRFQQIKNFITILFLSKGVPMILSGDEMKRSQNGNNNCYKFDDQRVWLNWDLANQNTEILNFFKKMIKLRKETYHLQTKDFYGGPSSASNARGLKDINWHGTKLGAPDWSDNNARAFSFTIAGVSQKEIAEDDAMKKKERFKDQDIHVMMNMYWEPLTFEIPQISGRNWSRYVDTFENENSEDILHSETTYLVRPRSVVVLVSRESNQ